MKSTKSKKEKSGKEKSGINGLDLIGFAAIIVIIVSLIVVLMKISGLTGYATYNISTATVNVSVSSATQINFTVNNINFGPGVVTSGINATLDSNATSAVGGTWAYSAQRLLLENIGTTNATLHIKTGKNASDMFGAASTNPGYMYAINNNEASSCLNPGVTLGNWYNVNVTGNGTMVCGNFTNMQSANSINLTIKLVVPSDSVSGAIGDIITATASG